MNAVVAALSGQAIPRLQVRSLCSAWNIGAEKLYQLLFVMESVGVLRIIRKQHDSKAHTVGHKLFLGDPVYYPILGGHLGTAREALFVSMVSESGYKVHAAKDETKGDFILLSENSPSMPTPEITVEVGGQKKERKQSDFTVKDNIDYPSGRFLPLWAFGFLY